MTVVLKFITHTVKGSNFVVEVKGLHYSTILARRTPDHRTPGHPDTGEGDTETLCIHSSNSQDLMGSPFIEKNWLVLCQALNQSFSSMSDMHGSLDGLCNNIVVKKARRGIVGLGKLRGERRTGNPSFRRRGSQKIRFP